MVEEFYFTGDHAEELRANVCDMYRFNSSKEARESLNKDIEETPELFGTKIFKVTVEEVKEDV